MLAGNCPYQLDGYVYIGPGGFTSSVWCPFGPLHDADWVLLSKELKPKSKIMIIEIGEANS
jgi:hypothetical protein